MRVKEGGRERGKEARKEREKGEGRRE